MESPKEIHIGIKNVYTEDVTNLIEKLDEFILKKEIDYMIVLNKNKIIIYSIQNIEVALRIMSYLETNYWKWNEYYEKDL